MELVSDIGIKPIDDDANVTVAFARGSLDNTDSELDWDEDSLTFADCAELLDDGDEDTVVGAVDDNNSDDGNFSDFGDGDSVAAAFRKSGVVEEGLASVVASASHASSNVAAACDKPQARESVSALMTLVVVHSIQKKWGPRPDL